MKCFNRIRCENQHPSLTLSRPLSHTLPVVTYSYKHSIVLPFFPLTAIHRIALGIVQLLLVKFSIFRYHFVLFFIFFIF